MAGIDQRDSEEEDDEVPRREIGILENFDVETHIDELLLLVVGQIFPILFGGVKFCGVILPALGGVSSIFQCHLEEESLTDRTLDRHDRLTRFPRVFRDPCWVDGVGYSRP